VSVRVRSPKGAMLGPIAADGHLAVATRANALKAAKIGVVFI